MALEHQAQTPAYSVQIIELEEFAWISTPGTMLDPARRLVHVLYGLFPPPPFSGSFSPTSCDQCFSSSSSDRDCGLGDAELRVSVPIRTKFGITAPFNVETAISM